MKGILKKTSEAEVSSTQSQRPDKKKVHFVDENPQPVAIDDDYGAYSVAARKHPPHSKNRRLPVDWLKKSVYVTFPKGQRAVDVVTNLEFIGLHYCTDNDIQRIEALSASQRVNINAALNAYWRAINGVVSFDLMTQRTIAAALTPLQLDDLSLSALRDFAGQQRKKIIGGHLSLIRAQARELGEVDEDRLNNILSQYKEDIVVLSDIDKQLGICIKNRNRGLEEPEHLQGYTNEVLRCIQVKKLARPNVAEDLSDEERQFLQSLNDKISVVHNKVYDLYNRGHFNAAFTALGLVRSIKDESNFYFAKDAKGRAEYREKFKQNLQGAIDQSRPVLEKHRDGHEWKMILGNLTACVAGLGIGYVIYGLYKKEKTGNFLLFNSPTDSSEKLDELESVISTASAPAKLGQSGG